MNTMQQEFDAVVEHLFKQGRPAKRGEECLYRGPRNTSCAVGCRIPDDVYEESMDVAPIEFGTGVGSLIKRFGDVLPPEIGAYSGMFLALQNAHDTSPTKLDGSFRLELLANRLREVADKCSLTFVVPEHG